MPPDLSLLKPSIITNGVDMVIVREIVSGIYFSEHTTNGDTATDVMKYTEAELAKPTKFATNDVDYTIDFRRRLLFSSSASSGSLMEGKVAYAPLITFDSLFSTRPELRSPL
ncbi:hypothetical protein PF005_g19989 [Phytophthora fragariae]|uniref:Isopropylmalate dehydrogenase-like domain-containing protein n=1 Tax=Phytophthora fragariae TaxID=53985 RepID=A0A6A4A5R3_9STRA|nr:hypothetical protein PF003_g1641 [Phytophthora fragariae]KAE8934814.1 hypothetical protein PF009_g15218 [Phytophthora fragariae]KAE8980975.1 hypothetical protein PF011_g22219 [Phytophthora fragariae]KAE9078946.1 hypothetical protein PF010_g22945 [Phytophthora fragariae]KAE9099577.1 hypothetical protein PF006_g23105 [Phytophthora fragariae]